MLYKTRALVLNHIKYRETSIIAKLYTEEFGVQSYIVNSVRSKNSKTKIALFQPLTLLDLVVYHKPNGSLQRISELKCAVPFKSIPFEIRKSAIAIFLAEILTKTMKEESANKYLFEFLFHSVADFDYLQNDFENFHLKFLIELSSFLGFMPSSATDIFNTGFIKDYSNEEFVFLDKLIHCNMTDSIKTENPIRRNCLDHILDFYTSHIENFGNVNSVRVLKEVLTT